jgi:hypothetical protein
MENSLNFKGSLLCQVSTPVLNKEQGAISKEQREDQGLITSIDNFD